MINTIDLSGEWLLAMDKDCTGKMPQFNDSIVLPDTTSHAGKGEDNPARETGFLTDTKKFEGDAWFRRTVDLSAAKGKTAKLFLERTRLTSLYIDGTLVGSRDSLTTAHIYDISEYAHGEHEITICVSNHGYPIPGGHLTSPDTQTNWNGITGEISVRIYNNEYADDVRVYPLFDEKSFRITGKVVGGKSGVLEISAKSFNAPDGKPVHIADPIIVSYENGCFEAVLPLGEDARTWDEYSPELYRICVDINGDKTFVTAGLKEFKAIKDKFYINGRKTFLRGKHDGLIFPKTGFAPTDVSEWVRILNISKSYGMNHYRFHTCCPPEAAFEAADIVGIYMEPQLPFWGTVAAPGEEGFNAAEQEYLIEEGFRMLKAYGNHPSYCMMSMGNELWGSTERLNEIIGGYKKFDPRHLYTQGSNNFQWFPNVVENDDFFVGVRLAKDRLIRGSYAMCDAPLGHIQTEKPSTMHNYDSIVHPTVSASSAQADEDGMVKIQYGTTMKLVKATEADADFIPEVPIVTHEIGQFETYPNFDEIEKYTGSIKARNFEVFRERLDEKGLLPLAHDYFEASGALAVACYKEEMESVFRSESLGGFQILDIQDFSGQGTALVGVLDAFMEEKGICSPEQWRQFCNDVVILAEFESYCLEAGQEFSARIRLANFRPTGIEGKKFVCELKCECGEVLTRCEGVVPSGENYLTLGCLSVKIPDTTKPVSLTLSLMIEGTDISNGYTLTAYPKRESVGIDGAYIFKSVNDEAKKLLSEGRTVLILPDMTDEEKYIDGFYCQDFWCYPMFRSISDMMNKPRPVGTMGLLIDSSHPVFKDFPTEKYSTPQWWDIVSNSKSEILDGCSQDKNVIIRTIDNFERNHDLALMYEYNFLDSKVVVCNCSLDKLSESPEGRQFVYSLISYVSDCNK
ncbi:MAG: glycoside hydrolase family 2 TIM barrel-domain containing protein [Oscillospiraceae bacterium]